MENIQQSKKSIWVDFLLTWGLILPVLTGLSLTLLYFKELGFFVDRQIPVQLIQVEVLGSIPDVLLAFSVLSGASIISYLIESKFVTEKKKSLFVKFLPYYLLLLIYGTHFLLYIIYETYHFIVLAIIGTVGWIFTFVSIAPARSLERIRIGLAILSFAFIGELAILIGARMGLQPNSGPQKRGHTQYLLRKYSDYSIYYAFDTAFGGKMDPFIIVQYSPGSADTFNVVK